MVTFIFVRHGESTDNTRSLWAGWRDSPLTNHGMSAKALGAKLCSVHFKAIHCSDLKRAAMTTEVICDAQPDPKPQIHKSILLREQHYGSGEGKRWDGTRISGLTLAEHYGRGVYPALHGRSEKFPGGESLDDLAARADTAISDILLPYVQSEGQDGTNIAVVSHGLFLSELIAALVRRDDTFKLFGRGIQSRDFRGMKNTGWTKVVVAVKRDTLLNGRTDIDASGPLPLHIKVTNINNCDHLLSLRRQRGGIASSAFDPNQRDIRGFFRGAGKKGDHNSAAGEALPS